MRDDLDSSAHKMLRGEIIDYSRAYRTCEYPNAMLVDAVHMIAKREWQGENNDVDDRVMRTSVTVFMEKTRSRTGQKQ